MISEKRTVDRSDSTTSVDALFRALRDHVASEELQNEQHELQRQRDMAEIKALLKPLDDMWQSLPRDEYGAPSPYLHRRQHETQTSVYTSTKKFREGFMVEAGKMLLISLIILASTGHLARWTSALLGAAR